MKKVLITGKNSYIGRSFKSYVEANYPSEIQVDSISVRGDAWREYDFSSYDAVLHVAAIVHKDEKDISLENYLEVNRNLALEIAKKAKISNVSHFIFMSTVAVYAVENNCKITLNSSLNPKTKYGKSKLSAENKLKQIVTSDFSITIIRPPMIYGPACPGNYNRLSKLAKKWAIYPKFTNQRSMIFIDNLSEFLYQIVKKRISGIYLPQNQIYVNTSDLIKLIRKKHGENTVLLPGFARLLKILIKYSSTLNKVYGTLKIDFALSTIGSNYNKISFDQSVEETEYSVDRKLRDIS
ncbi:NAD-dependent epimerase/dehydratase family protein [Loigolactobacillus coryniformis]|uniref:UDP-glucose 4-epimerase n=1 Tax=Loigolactobacillus coryniformis subsp. coryniformis CECT 5711 TaxID=1185325 RepID=J3JCD5_9LACO|nr:NAD-dependent epimerase/dehydratase family protein [Loigolactobacillus coryniformis]EJN56509.1 UDP-glucose 4-epimerase [Loigolactobacillus coryniformis subsp. coryniformis CECT 5711]